MIPIIYENDELLIINKPAGLAVQGGAGEIPLCLIRLQLETGRMHQIRIHLAKQGCPIAGDDQHGNFKMNKLLKKVCKIKRLQLSAVRLTIPLNGNEKTFEIPVPFELPE